MRLCKHLILVLLLATPVAAQTPFILTGPITSANLGEQPVSLLTTVGVGFPNAELRGAFDTSDKYTGAGWIASGEAEVFAHLSWSPLVGVRYCYRDGGPWAKQGMWLRGGVRWEGTLYRVTLTARSELAFFDAYHIRGLDWHVERDLGSWRVSLSQGLLYSNPPDWGFYSALQIGRVFQRRE